MRRRRGQRGTTAWSLDVTQRLAAQLRRLRALVEQLEPVLQAEIAAQQNATLAAEEEANGAVGTSIQPFHFFDVDEFDLE